MFITRIIFIYILQSILRLTIVLALNSCLDENNNTVDWFVIYKIPKLKKHVNPIIKAGLAYAYITSETNQGWILSNKSINDSTSMPGITLAALYGSQDELYILYNDQPPDGNTSFTGGHTKGVVIAGSSGGFWLVHSVPHYPPPPPVKRYNYPKTGLKNGQSFLCVSVPSNHIDNVGSLLMYNYPHIFASQSPSELTTQYPLLTKAASGKDIGSPPWFQSDPLVSVKGNVFQSFAKSPKFNKDLYSDWVTATLKVSLLVETWPNGPGRLNSSCHQPYRAENVNVIKLPVVKQSFSSHKDHSKWAISEEKDQPWVCIGDINRAVSQEKRGGGTVCLKDSALWQAFYSCIISVESCPKEPYLSEYKDKYPDIIKL